MTQELKPCPMCDGEAYLTKGFCAGAQWPGEFHRVYCGTCQLRQLFHKTPSDAVTAWNSRALATPAPLSDEPVASWAPERIWLQRGVGEEGSHTWCEHQIGEDSIGDAIEEAEYVRADRAPLATPSGKQEAVRTLTFARYEAFEEAGRKVDREMAEFRKMMNSTPLAQSAEQDRIDAETWREILVALLREIPHNKRAPGNAPGHGHMKPGIWDNDNGALSGTECAWCKAWNAAHNAIAKGASK